MRLKGKVAIVTGAAQGIGAAYATALAEAGAAVAFWDVEEPLATAATINGRARRTVSTSRTPHSSQPRSRTRQRRSARSMSWSTTPPCSATGKPAVYRDSAAEWDRVMAVNVRGTMECVKGGPAAHAAQNMARSSMSVLHRVPRHTAPDALCRLQGGCRGDDPLHGARARR